MRPLRHLTPRYICNRIRWKSLHWRKPELPYLNPQIVAILDDILQPDDVGMEWGSGASTIWFAARCGKLFSVEHDPSWAELVGRRLEQRHLEERVDLRLCRWSCKTGIPASYTGAGREQRDESLDFALIDGRKRDDCALVVLSKLKPGGILIVDDIHRYLPRERPSSAPQARGAGDGCASEKWAQFARAVGHWRCIWRLDGVSDTALWIKPATQGPAPTEALPSTL